MKEQGLTLTGLLLLLFFGMRFLPSSGQAISESDLKGAAEALNLVPKTEAIRLPAVWETLCQLNPSYGSSNYDRKKMESISEESPDPACLGELPANSIVPVIATVADPVGSHLRLWTDRMIESVQVAAAEADYIPYLQGLPWPVSGQEKEYKPFNTRSPGVLVLRKSSKGDAETGKSMVILLVPETPTSGLDKQVFFTALRIIKHLGPTAVPFKVANISTNHIAFLAGPGFSGSVSSLQKFDRELGRRGETWCFHAFSGTITNAQWDDSDGNCSSLTNIQTPDKEVIVPPIITAALGYHPSEVAILSEAGTQYGRVMQKETTEQEPSDETFLSFPRGIANLRNASENKPASSNQTQSATTQKEQIPLTWQDSDAAYNGDVISFAAKQTALSEETVLLSLSDTLKRRGIKAMGIMATDPWDVAFLIHWFRETSPNVRLFVRDVDLVYLRARGAGAITGILAISDFPLFADNQIWSSNNKIRSRLLNFSSSTQESQFDAFMALMREIGTPLVNPDQLISLAGNWSAVRSGDITKRPLWVSVTGTSGYFPVKWVPRNKRALPVPDFHSLDVGKPSYSATVLWTVVTILALWHALALFDSCQRKAKDPRRSSWLVPSFIDTEFTMHDKRDLITFAKLVCHIVSISVVLLATYISGSAFLFFFSAPYAVYPFPLAVHPFLWMAILAATSGIVILLAIIRPVTLAIGMGREIYRIAKTEKKKNNGDKKKKTLNKLGQYVWATFARLWSVFVSAFTKKAANNEKEEPSPLRVGTEDKPWQHRNVMSPVLMMVGCGVFISLVVLAALGWTVTLSSGSVTAFLHLRDLNLASGVAPAIPLVLLLITIYLGIWVYLRRVSAWQYGSVEMPTVKFDDIFPGDCNPHVKFIDRCMLQFPPAPWGYVLLLTMFTTVLALRPWNSMDMLEAVGIQVFTVVAFVLALFILWANWFRFLVIWMKLRDMLFVLEKLPLRAAFSRLPKEGPLSLTNWSIPRRSILPVRQAIETLRALKPESNAIDPLHWANLMEQIRKMANHEQAREQLTVEDTARQVQSSSSGQEISGQEILPKAAGSENIALSRGSSSGPASKQNLADHNVLPFKQPAETADIGLADAGRTGVERVGAKPIATEPSEIGSLRSAMTAVISDLAIYLKDYWSRGKGPTPEADEKEKKQSENKDRMFELAEDFVVLRFYSYIRYVFTELRNILFFLVLGFCLLFLALHTYAFRADQTIDLSFVGLFLVMGTGIVIVLLQQEHDPLLSRLQRTKPDEVGRNFYFTLVKYGAVPLLTLVGSQVPAISSLLLRWIQPSLESLH